MCRVYCPARHKRKGPESATQGLSRMASRVRHPRPAPAQHQGVSLRCCTVSCFARPRRGNLRGTPTIRWVCQPDMRPYNGLTTRPACQPTEYQYPWAGSAIWCHGVDISLEGSTTWPLLRFRGLLGLQTPDAFFSPVSLTTDDPALPRSGAVAVGPSLAQIIFN